MDKVTGMIRQEEKSSRDQMETVTCMSLEEMEWSISIAELEEVQECGDVIYLIVMVHSRVSTSTLALLLQVFTVLYSESPEVVVSGEGSGVTGTSYTLTCRVSLPSGVEPDSLDIQWLGLPTPQPVMISTGVYISNVTLNPLLPNNTGYTCTASYTINGVSSLLVIESICITDISKFLTTSSIVFM